MLHLDEQGQIVSEWSTLINIPRRSRLGATAIHGIDRQMLTRAPQFAELIGELSHRLQGRIIVGHVLDFDVAHLAAEFARVGAKLPDIRRSGMCTRELARAQSLDGPHNLANCCAHAQLSPTDLHTALGDARATAGLLRYFLRNESPEQLDRLAGLAGATTWPVTDARPVRLKPRSLDQSLPKIARPSTSAQLETPSVSAKTLAEGTIGRLDQLIKRVRSRLVVDRRSR